MRRVSAKSICDAWALGAAAAARRDRASTSRSWVSARSASTCGDGWDRLSITSRVLVTLGFDGSRFDDATAIVMTEVETGHQSLIGLWEKPPTADPDWEVPEAEVDDTIHEAFERWSVWRLYADPRWWESWIATWAGEWGKERVIAWYTGRLSQMAYALRSFATAIQAEELSHDSNEDLSRHIGNACRRTLNLRDAEGERLWVIQKERPDSPFKIDAGMAAVLSWEARNDAITAGAKAEEPSVYEERGIVLIG